MRTVYTSILALPTFLLLSNALPFAPQIDTRPQKLVRRAKYSVVPVDGGIPAATGEDGSEPIQSTIIQTVIHTAPQATKTIIEKPLPTTNYISVTKTIEGPEATETSLVTIKPSPATVTTTGYSIINVNSPPVTVEIPALPRTSTITSSVLLSKTSTSSISTSAIAVESSTTADRTSSIESFPTSTASSKAVSEPTVSTTTSLRASETLTASITSSSPTGAASIISSYLVYTSDFPSEISVTSVVASTTTTTYDNGQWHTTYPSWSNSTKNENVVARRHANPSPLIV